MDEKLKVKKYGLIGKDIGYSFSRNYFGNKFSTKEEFSNLTYENFDIDSISKIQEIFKIDNLVGLNVTIPYKKEVIPYLDELSDTAKVIGAVNTICFKNDIKIGHNTDVIGFKKALKNILSKKPKKAIILGTGGASRAIEYVLKSEGIDIVYVSRKPINNQIHYKDLNNKIMEECELIINCTPLGTFPKINDAPDIPYEFLSSNNCLFDLIYNPEKTKFMKNGIKMGAKVTNGYNMLIQQAEASWKLWK